jgi:hypothetical protein
MPRYRNQFAGPSFIQETIITQEGTTIGVIRIKPSSVLWKPSGERQFYCVPLDRFIDWITSRRTRAARTGS